jgi:hypothetical protein
MGCMIYYYFPGFDLARLNQNLHWYLHLLELVLLVAIHTYMLLNLDSKISDL